MFKEIKTSIQILVLMTLVTGIGYPLLVTVAAQRLFPVQAGGSLIWQGETVVGSALIGQSFSRPEYFWGRPSATTLLPANATGSGGSNLGPSNPELKKLAERRAAELAQYEPGARSIPIDLLTASASGLDPHISPAAAEFQVARVARLRQLPVEEVRRLVLAATEDRQLGILGEPRVNVLKLNLSLK